MFQDLEASIEYENPDHEFLKEYVNYRIGKHFDYGLGVDQDYDKAKNSMKNPKVPFQTLVWEIFILWEWG